MLCEEIFRGSGQIDDPYLVENLTQLDMLRHIQNDYDAVFQLACDIDATETRFWKRGSLIGFQPLPIFSGIFSGNGHTIKNLCLATTNIELPSLPFEMLAPSGIIENLHLENLMIMMTTNKDYRIATIEVPLMGKAGEYK